MEADRTDELTKRIAWLDARIADVDARTEAKRDQIQNRADKLRRELAELEES